MTRQMRYVHLRDLKLEKKSILYAGAAVDVVIGVEELDDMANVEGSGVGVIVGDANGLDVGVIDGADDGLLDGLLEVGSLEGS